jgi:hypothetical protein
MRAACWRTTHALAQSRPQEELARRADRKIAARVRREFRQAMRAPASAGSDPKAPDTRGAAPGAVTGSGRDRNSGSAGQRSGLANAGAGIGAAVNSARAFGEPATPFAMAPAMASPSSDGGEMFQAPVSLPRYPAGSGWRRANGEGVRDDP